MIARFPAQFSEAASRAAGQVLPALQQAAERTGVEFSALFNTARLESSFNPDAKARTSSATGLFQFIDSTWLSTLRKHGAAHGINASSREEALALRKNPAVASLMAAEHMADNAATLERGLGRAASSTDLYLAHFLGSGGAIRFLKGLATNPAMAAADLMPSAARANRAIFFSGFAPRSLQDVHDLLSKRFNGTSVPAQAATGGMNVPPRIAEAPVDRTPKGADGATVDPRRAAHAAYLLLAELGA